MRLIAVLLAWFATSAFFNDCTPRLRQQVVLGGGEGEDVTVIELFVTVAIGVATLLSQGQRLVPPPELRTTVAAAGCLHLIGCRLFMTSLAYIPVSLAQTIRAANPLVVVVVGALFLGQRYALRVLAALVPIVGGFALAVSADAELELAGIAASVGSVVCLVLVNAISKSMLRSGGSAVASGEVQFWLCTAALLLLLPLWAAGGGPARLAAVVTESEDATYVLGLCVLDGALYFAEQVAQLKAISMLSNLTLAVVDTVRRLWIVVVAGFVLQGNPVTARGVAGAAAVCVGALAYAQVSSVKKKKQV